MTRRNFSRKTLAKGFLRAGGKCELCQAKLKTGEGIGDHILPDALGGDPTLENLQIICSVCDKAKTKNDVRQIRKADRQRDKHTGAAKSKNPMPGSRRSKFKRRFDGKVVLRDA